MPMLPTTCVPPRRDSVASDGVVTPYPLCEAEMVRLGLINDIDYLFFGNCELECFHQSDDDSRLPKPDKSLLRRSAALTAIKA